MGLGDALMVSGQARVMQQTDPRKCRVTHDGIALKWSSIWDHNPRIARHYEQGDFQELAARGRDRMRPYHTAKTPERWHYNLGFRPEVGEIYFTDDEKAFGRRFAGRIIIEPHIKIGASPNKQWGWARWNKLVYLMGRAGLRATQMGQMATPLLDGAEFVETTNFRKAAAALANARAAVLPEGGLHHTAAALNVPAVVIFGGFTPVELTGYPMHVNLGASLGEACGCRLPCEHCAKAMAAIDPVDVFDHLLRMLNAKR